jgi:hypothetical protein
LLDWSAFKRHGTLTNGAAFGLSGGRYAVTMDGINDFVSIGAIPQLVAASRFTIHTWVRFSSFASSVINTVWVFGQSATNNFANDILLYANPTTGVLFAQVNNAADGGASGPALSIDIWYAVTIVFDGSQTGNSNRLKMFINGVQQTLSFGAYSVPSATANIASPSFVIGQYSVSTAPVNTYLNGSVAEVLVLPRAATASEVSVLAVRPGISHELAPRRRSSVASAFNRRRRLLLGSI